jgi:iron complex outermembrane receptor protein
VGIEVRYQSDRRKNFNNIAGDPGEELSLNQDEDVTSIGPYIQEEFSILDNLTLVLGGRYDNVRFKVNDFFISDGDDDSGSRTFDQLTGRGGLLYSPIPEVNLYVNVAQSFETPTITELVNRRDASGGLNPDIDPQKATNYEIGVKGQAFGRFACELALYYISIRDELVPSVEGGRTFFDNAGKSRRYGVEFGLAMQLISGLRTNVAYTYLDAEFRDFEIGNDDLRPSSVFRTCSMKSTTPMCASMTPTTASSNQRQRSTSMAA